MIPKILFIWIRPWLFENCPQIILCHVFLEKFSVSYYLISTVVRILKEEDLTAHSSFFIIACISVIVKLILTFPVPTLR